MPSTITHTYIGIDTMNKLNNKPKKMIQKHFNNYKVYCQNMDVLYFYHILLLKTNKIQDLGHRFHKEKVFEYFNTLINDNKANKNEELFTFIAGLITHYQADSIMHPYINFLSNNKKNNLITDKHFEIETYLDNYFINKYETNNYQKTNNTNLVFNYTKEPIIIDEINKIFKLHFNFQNIGNIYYQSLNEMKFVFKYIRHDKYGIKKKIYEIIDLNPFNIKRTKYLSYHFHLDNDDYYLNTNHQIWWNVKDKTKTSNKSFLELYDEVTNKSSYIINELYQYIFENKNVNLKALIGNISYSTGLPISPIQ